MGVIVGTSVNLCSNQRGVERISETAYMSDFNSVLFKSFMVFKEIYAFKRKSTSLAFKLISSLTVPRYPFWWRSTPVVIPPNLYSKSHPSTLNCRASIGIISGSYKIWPAEWSNLHRRLRRCRDLTAEFRHSRM